MADSMAAGLLRQETRALLCRLARLKPLVLQETMVVAAAIAPAALLEIEDFLIRGRRELRAQIERFLAWLDGRGPRTVTPAHAQRRFTFLKLRFNAVLTQLDIFGEAMSQRSENETGVWLAGLDEAAADALALPGVYEPPPIVCYLARDAGGAIRRARTRLPGGGENPVALIRLPRERMIGSGIASSLVHEVGHQAASLLDLVTELRPVLIGTRGGSSEDDAVWACWRRWISEVVADLWAVGKVGVASTLGLMSLVSLPRAFVFRTGDDDPHPAPWIRVKLSCALGDALYPDPQWRRLAALWESFYPPDALPLPQRAWLRALEDSLPAFVERLLDHRPESLRGRRLAELLMLPDRTPARLSSQGAVLVHHPSALPDLPPTAAFAALGQARLDERITPEEESHTLAVLLRRWAVRASWRHRRRTTAAESPFIQFPLPLPTVRRRAAA